MPEFGGNADHHQSKWEHYVAKGNEPPEVPSVKEWPGHDPEKHEQE